MAAPTGARPPPPEPSPFPYAAAPDIIRAHQKDAYFSGVLTNQLTDLHRRLLGARSAHAWAGPARQAADVAYLALTTLIGNRTLGEEYCDLLQVESEPALPLPFLGDGAGYNSRAPRLPSVARRAAYIVASILVPHLFSRLLPSIRGVLRRRLEARLRTLAARAGRAASSAPAAAAAAATTTTTPTSSLKKSGPQKTAAPVVPLEARIERYILEHLPVLTSAAPWQAAALTAFYFGGAYYSLAKRAVGLRYIFTRNVTGGPAAAGRDGRGGYEILGVLMVVQFAIQAYLHARSVLAGPAPSGSSSSSGADELAATHHHHAYGVEVSLDHEHSFAANNGLLLFPGELAAAGADGSGAGATAIDVPRATHTPVAPAARYDLSRDGPAAMMGWIKGQHQRKCTLCLDEMRDPAATSCGHVFCWSCIGDWVREKPECPLCRREALVQHILPLRAALAA